MATLLWARVASRKKLEKCLKIAKNWWENIWKQLKTINKLKIKSWKVATLFRKLIKFIPSKIFSKSLKSWLWFKIFAWAFHVFHMLKKQLSRAIFVAFASRKVISQPFWWIEKEETNKNPCDFVTIVFASVFNAIEFCHSLDFFRCYIGWWNGLTFNDYSTLLYLLCITKIIFILSLRCDGGLLLAREANSFLNYPKHNFGNFWSLRSFSVTLTLFYRLLWNILQALCTYRCVFSCPCVLRTLTGSWSKYL